MTAYVIVQVRIHDPARFDKYVTGFMPVLHQYGGRLLATDGQPEAIEGDWTGDRLVILEFEDREACHTWLASPEYQEIVPHRWAAADTTLLLVRGLE